MEFKTAYTALQGITECRLGRHVDELPWLPTHVGEYALTPLKNHTAIGPNKYFQPWVLEKRTVRSDSRPCTELVLSRRPRGGSGPGSSPPQGVVRVSADMQSMVVHVPNGEHGWDEVKVRRSAGADGPGNVWAFEMDVLDGREKFEWRHATPATSDAVRGLYAVRGRLAKAVYARVLGGPSAPAGGWELVRIGQGRGEDAIAAVAGRYRTPNKCRKFNFTELGIERVLGQRFAVVAYMTSLGVTMVQ